MNRVALAIVLTLSLPGCTIEVGSPVGDVHCEPIEGGQFQACYGPRLSEFNVDSFRVEFLSRYHSYEVSVRRVESPDMSLELFSKSFSTDQVDARRLTNDSSKVFTYDVKTRTVHFNLVTAAVSYQLPS